MAFTKLKILVGTMTGNAEYTAQAIQMDCAHLIDPIEVLRMDDLGPDVLTEPGALVLICCSTFGAGDVPDNAQNFYARIQNEPQDLSALRYGVLALGDSSYTQTFAGGGRRFDAALADLGAQRLGDIFIHDATGGDAPEEVGTAWARAWLTQALG